MEGLGPLALAPMFPELIKSFHSDLSGVVQFTGIAILVLGFSNFIWYYPSLGAIAGLRSRLIASGFP